MYLQRIKLKHIRLFESDEIEFAHQDGSPRMFTVIIAENGQAKTTLLQAIALAAAGVGGANKLASNAASFFDKRWNPARDHLRGVIDAFEIDANFSFSQGLHAFREYPGVSSKPEHPSTLRAMLFAPLGWKQFEGGSSLERTARRDAGASFGERRPPPLDEARARDLSSWFVAGYGTSRALPLPHPPTESGNRSIDRLGSLFRPEPLLATGFVDVLSRQYGPEVARDYARTLRDILVGSKMKDLPGLLPRDGAVRVEDIELRGQGGVRASSDLTDAERVLLRFGDGEEVKVPAVWLSSGYQSTMAWVADLVGQIALEAQRVIPPAEMEGVVLIDEIDQALHPRWQATLVPALKKTFPRIQFIVTTHSPMILPGLAPGEVIVLRANERGSIQHERPEEDPRLLTAAQLYREFFGMEGLFPSAVGDRLRRYGMLAGVVERTEDEEAEVQRLYAQLRAEGVEVWAPEPRQIAATDAGTTAS